MNQVPSIATVPGAYRETYGGTAPGTVTHQHGMAVVNLSGWDDVPYRPERKQCEAMRSQVNQRCGSLIPADEQFCFYHRQKNSESK
jgi:hypothetical protein